MKRRVGHWMMRNVLSAPPDEALYRAVEMMAEQQIRHVLVVDGEGELQGIVSNRDLIRGALRHPERKLDLHDTTLADVMTRAPLQTTTPDALLEEAADAMFRFKVNALPVLEGGKLAGILTSEDVLSAVAAGDPPQPRPNA